jgi:hypothetical protein
MLARPYRDAETNSYDNFDRIVGICLALSNIHIFCKELDHCPPGMADLLNFTPPPEFFEHFTQELESQTGEMLRSMEVRGVAILDELTNWLNEHVLIVI